MRPVTVMGEDEPLAVRPPGDAVTVYPVMADPLLTEGLNETVAAWSAGVAVTALGAPGTPGSTGKLRETVVAGAYVPLPD